MRVISGTAKRVSLVAPQGQSTRPTADMAKESLFNIIGADIPQARFLDLFCGSGAIGLEALSRGAAEAALVDSSKDAMAATAQNLEKTRLTPRATLWPMPAAKAIMQMDACGQVFDIIFLDPPYDTDLLSQTLDLLGESGLLAPGGMIIAEADAKLYKANPVTPPKTLKLTSERVYGRTCFLFYRRDPA